jgi:hypothetical protein
MSRGLRSLGSSGLGPPSPSAQNASETNAAPLEFTRARLGGPPIQPGGPPIQLGIPPQFLSTPTTTSQTGPSIDVNATRQIYGGAVPQQSQIAAYQRTGAGSKLYNSLFAHRSSNTSSSTSSSATTPDISKYAGMSADEISKRISQLERERAQREQDFAGRAGTESEALSKSTKDKEKNRKALSQVTKGKMSEAKRGPHNPMYRRTHTEDTLVKMYENSATRGVTGANHPASKSYHLMQLPPEARVIPELQKWSVSEIKLQADLIKNRHTYSTTQSPPNIPQSPPNIPQSPPNIPQTPPSYYAENPLFFIPTAGPSQPPQSPPKQDDPDIIDY